MRFLIVDGNPRADASFDGRLSALEGTLAAAGHEVESIRLREKRSLRPAAPSSHQGGEADRENFDGDPVDFMRSCLHADGVFFVSPLVGGFPPPLLETAMECLMPLVRPYVEVAEGAPRPLRYGVMPKVALFYDCQVDAEEDLRPAMKAFERFARDAHTDFLFARPLGDPLGAMRQILEAL